MAKRDLPVAKNQKIDVEISDLTYQGMGVAKINGYPLFIANSLIGEKCQVHVLKVGKKFGFAKVIERYNDSPDRVALRDEDGLRTGTMSLQHMAYPAQLKLKQKTVKDSLKKFTSLSGVEVKPCLGMTDPWAYRNKAQVPVAGQPGQLYTGFYRQNSHEILPIKNYQIQLPGIDEALQTVISILNHYHVSSYDEKTGKGLIRHLVVRKGYYTNELMLVIVINGHELPQATAIKEELLQALPNLVSVVINHNLKKTNVIMGAKQTVLYGQDVYHDQMLGLDFAISAKSFFQVNTPQAERLYQEAVRVGEISSEETVIDAYCGIGSISLCLAQSAHKVYGVEVVEDAIAMAEANARANQIDNVEFQVGKAEDVIRDWQAEGIHPHTVVVDPPRKGLAQDFVETVIELSPDKIVYVSCNPATLARDLNLFVSAGYHAKSVQPVDLFPQTPHVEACVLLTKNKV
ncbi:23S rRNA (uracil(1939)-C(5))-methyltransferase RlmD [Aerococcus kribbianus]|uniref:23S rRNA (Uracil(1939)-C(5))-methyltransferase RlmD n=1 Tax=Aerococcus kribbianus TaxID=2999064 RepID=A0A9X3FN27_9LACT|nr:MULTISPECIES: 23S rRNA (uracil(1939)-C(5))-methyltransferase RlmD [unclassified Aerococcus]MCZ0717460.1 23S rRNA (uracil(1939)-C(5))-methyltransferase RlmD [Aerococcus sp. YH-aer221]MCZ0725748.1 23S rRNA (uracil(1939)-C(5))-methyltransferase RlmD [Aerococcus sp. YH-aer222]